MTEKVNYFNGICRLCTKKSPVLFNIYDKDKDGTSSAAKIKIICGIKVLSDDSYPKSICTFCRRKLRNSYEFRSMCLSSVKVLDKYIQEQLRLPEPNTDEDNTDSEFEVRYYIEVDESISSAFETTDLKWPEIRPCFPPEDLHNKITEEKPASPIVESKPTVESPEIDVPTFEQKPAEEKEEEPPKENEEESPKENEIKKEEPPIVEVKKPAMGVKRKRSLGGRKENYFPDKRHKCKVCKKLFGSELRVKLHMQRIHRQIYLSECKVACSKCGMKFQHLRNLKRHLVYHNTDSYFGCEFCDKKLYSKKSWRNHIKVHDEQINIICKICNKTITSKVSQVYHMGYHRAKENIANKTFFSCHTCKIDFQHFQDLEVHSLQNHCLNTPAEHDYLDRETKEPLAKKAEESAQNSVEIRPITNEEFKEVERNVERIFSDIADFSAPELHQLTSEITGFRSNDLTARDEARPNTAAENEQNGGDISVNNDPISSLSSPDFKPQNNAPSFENLASRVDFRGENEADLVATLSSVSGITTENLSTQNDLTYSSGFNNASVAFDNLTLRAEIQEVNLSGLKTESPNNASKNTEQNLADFLGDDTHTSSSSSSKFNAAVDFENLAMKQENAPDLNHQPNAVGKKPKESIMDILADSPASKSSAFGHFENLPSESKGKSENSTESKSAPQSPIPEQKDSKTFDDNNLDNALSSPKPTLEPSDSFGDVKQEETDVASSKTTDGTLSTDNATTFPSSSPSPKFALESIAKSDSLENMDMDVEICEKSAGDLLDEAARHTEKNGAKTPENVPAIDTSAHFKSENIFPPARLDSLKMETEDQEGTTDLTEKSPEAKSAEENGADLSAPSCSSRPSPTFKPGQDKSSVALDNLDMSASTEEENAHESNCGKDFLSSAPTFSSSGSPSSNFKMEVDDASAALDNLDITTGTEEDSVPRDVAANTGRNGDEFLATSVPSFSPATSSSSSVFRHDGQSVISENLGDLSGDSKGENLNVEPQGVLAKSADEKLVDDAGASISSKSNLGTDSQPAPEGLVQTKTGEESVVGQKNAEKKGPSTASSSFSKIKPRNLNASVTFRCNICARFFKNLPDLQLHVKECFMKIDRPKQFMCDICGKCFSSTWTLTNHKAGHSTARPFICDICGQRFKWYNDLTNHKSRIHEKFRPYVCKLCGKRCGTSATLKSHMRFHTGERPYICSVCNVSFAQNSSLKEHMFKHTGGQEGTCPICNKVFKTPLRLRTHVKRHNTQRKLFPCDLCGRMFTEKGTVRKHKFKIHNEVN